MQKKIDFINRLLKLASCQDDLFQFLVDEKLLNDFDKGVLKEENDKGKFFFNLLEKLKQDDKLLLLDYEWIVLPVERLKLTVITERDKREFNFNF